MQQRWRIAACIVGVLLAQAPCVSLLGVAAVWAWTSPSPQCTLDPAAAASGMSCSSASGSSMTPPYRTGTVCIVECSGSLVPSGPLLLDCPTNIGGAEEVWYLHCGAGNGCQEPLSIAQGSVCFDPSQATHAPTNSPTVSPTISPTQAEVALGDAGETSDTDESGEGAEATESDEPNGTNVTDEDNETDEENGTNGTSGTQSGNVASDSWELRPGAHTAVLALLVRAVM